MQTNNYDKFPTILPIIFEENFLYPFMISPLFLSDEEEMKAVEYAINENKMIVVGVYKDQKQKEFFDIGIAGTIMRKVTLPDGNIKILFQGLAKVKISKKIHSIPSQVEVDEIIPLTYNKEEVKVLIDLLKNKIDTYAKLNRVFPIDLLKTIDTNNDPNRIVDLISSVLKLEKENAYKILNEADVTKRLYMLLEFIQKEIESLKLKKEITKKVNQKIEQNNKNYFLKEQLKAIQQELGDDDRAKEIKKYKKKLKKLKPFISKNGFKEIKKQIQKLSRMHPDSADAALIQTYVEQVLDIPFDKIVDEKIDIFEVEEQLNKDHYSLKEPKERIVEYFALKEYLQSKNIPQDKKNSTIICFVGPPGVGKTSLANSIANALKRPLERIALGGLEDVNELRGHRRTYIGAMPGRIVQALINAKAMNPVIVLDEIDKLGANHRGDPSAVMLEILDPEQNDKFRDHYLNFEIDLSKIIFIATANTLSTIPAPLRDRLEIIEINSYTPTEKFYIAKNYLIPQELNKHGLKKSQISLTDATIKLIIDKYTREAGVRNLRRAFNKIFRKVVKQFIENNSLKKVSINSKNINEYLKKPVFEIDPADKKDSVGVVNGLAWTSVGGDVLKIEAVKFDGKGMLNLTGNLGEVMKESAKIAHSVVKSLINKKKLKGDFKKYDIHLHVPEGATPKDGPSAGIAMSLCLASILSNRKVRADLAMTGEVTLSGKVLPIGGLKEKLIAAYKANIKEVLIPEKNYKRDLDEIPDEIKQNLTITPVKNIEEVINIGLRL